MNPTTTIVYTLPKPKKVTLAVFNALGQRLVTLLPGDFQRAGKYTVIWNGRDDTGRLVSSGVYFYRLELESGLVKTSRMHLIR